MGRRIQVGYEKIKKVAIFDLYLALSRKQYKNHSNYGTAIGTRIRLSNGAIFFVNDP